MLIAIGVGILSSGSYRLLLLCEVVIVMYVSVRKCVSSHWSLTFVKPEMAYYVLWAGLGWVGLIHQRSQSKSVKPVAAYANMAKLRLEVKEGGVLSVL